ncbi:hypothetical protein [Flavobacterium sp.]|jgi:hypothetical protein|uniref:hypothetical protein n=1 Tax=Flavobacterium sp. TaxID=239 RepID=UPI0022C9680C|nr:hypothetical protein [Flavobacterium sp.]MCZ8144002.1 hypothetical protein [Flavobacterium sp.]MCZ8366487.1 hypothetical protein [Flavobacterium sp.]
MNPINLNNPPQNPSGFTVPEGYFETFSTRLQNRLEEETPVKSISFWSKHAKTFYGMAAVLVIGLGIGMLWHWEVQKEEEAHWSAIASYVSENTDLTDEHYLELIELQNTEVPVASDTEAKALEEMLLENEALEYSITH